MEIDFQAALVQQKPTLPKVEGYKNDIEAEKTAHNFTSVFFSEYVGLMLEEVENDEGDESFSFDVFKGVQAQALGERLADSPSGQKLTSIILDQIHKLQEKVEGGGHER